MDVVELLVEDPFIFRIIDLESTVQRHACGPSELGHEVIVRKVAYLSGWIALRSVPRTRADGYCSATEVDKNCVYTT